MQKNSRKDYSTVSKERAVKRQKHQARKIYLKIAQEMLKDGLISDQEYHTLFNIFDQCDTFVPSKAGEDFIQTINEVQNQVMLKIAVNYSKYIISSSSTQIIPKKTNSPSEDFTQSNISLSTCYFLK